MNIIKITCCTLFTLFMFTSLLAQDWANLKRFQKENSELKLPTTGEHRVVFMGNSITEFWLQQRPQFFNNKPYINRGISGQTTPQMVLRFRQDVVHLKPSIVVILAGINDIAGNTGPSTLQMIMDNIISMTELAKSNNIKVIVCSVLPANNFPWKKKIKPAEKVIELNTMIKSYADQNNITYVDYFSAMVNTYNGLQKDLGDDGVHPNAKGYAIMEPILETAIEITLKKIDD